jgi:hypothetical protein
MGYRRHRKPFAFKAGELRVLIRAVGLMEGSSKPGRMQIPRFTASRFRLARLQREPHVELSPSTVVLSSLKEPEDGAPAEFVVRLYEATGRATDARLRVSGATQAWLSDMREVKGQPLNCSDGLIALDLGAFEITTIRVLRQ